jgi:hypothetical protein
MEDTRALTARVEQARILAAGGPAPIEKPELNPPSPVFKKPELTPPLPEFSKPTLLPELPVLKRPVLKKPEFPKPTFRLPVLPSPELVLPSWQSPNRKRLQPNLIRQPNHPMPLPPRASAPTPTGIHPRRIDLGR